MKRARPEPVAEFTLGGRVCAGPVANLLEPGRKLDLLIMEYCLGWRWVRGSHRDVCGVDDPIWLLPKCTAVADVTPGEWCGYDDEDDEETDEDGFSMMSDDNRLTLSYVPCASTKLGAAAEVLDYLNKHGYVKIEVFPPGAGQLACVTTMPLGAIEPEEFRGETVMHALCLAALDFAGWRA